MSSINSGMGQPPIVSSIAGIGKAGKSSSSAQTAQSDNAAAKTVEKAHAEANGLKGTESSPDRDADGRQLYQPGEESVPNRSAESAPPQSSSSSPARSQDPHKKLGNVLDLDA
ncbi:MAG: hypothetical protein KDA84_13330 [Planctomycetaceae bacterium]|nr:hypothetical protein [Planctomycetaceae bacterium]